MREIVSGLETSKRELVGDVCAQTRTGVATKVEPVIDVQELNSLALRSLGSLFNEKEQLFSHRVTLTGNGICWDVASRKRSMVALMGLQRLAVAGSSQPFDLASIREAILREKSWVSKAGDLGLLAWFAAVCAPDRLDSVFKEFDFENALTNYPDGRQARTTCVAWFLAGVAHARLVCPESVPDLTDVAVDAYHMLRDNQSENGIFGHAGSAGFPLESLYSRLGTFSDQIYAIYALSLFARAFHVEEPLESALGCANEVCALQGEMGQWWFLYDKRTARIVNRYPVLSAHQDGTAPCGLLALEDTTGRSFSKAIHKGLSWITGANELGDDLRDENRAFIWDSIGPKGRIRRYSDAAIGFVFPRAETHVRGLGIQREARADHLGWLLYAFGRNGLPNS
jgi:hypothetical protein